MTKPMLQVNQISKDFATYSVLKNISFTIQREDIYGLVGRNGSGKTTLLAIISGLLKPDEGTIKINGNPYNPKQISMSFQPTSLYGYLTGKENLHLLSTQPEKAISIVKTLHPEQSSDVLNKKVKSLSYGQKQRLGLAIALSKKACLYLLDEPTNGLDVLSSENLSTLIHDMAKKGSSFILASHEWGIIEANCTRLGMIHEGQIIKELHVHDSKDEPTIRIKTRKSITKERFMQISTVKSALEISPSVWHIKLISKQDTNTFHKILSDEGISIEEFMFIHPTREWEWTYQQLSRGESV